MAIDRTTLIKGPGCITYASAQFFSDGDIVAELVEKWSDKITAGYGKIGAMLLDRYIEITFVPSMWASLSVLFPLLTAQPGDVLYGASDAPLVITPRNGRPLTIANAQITQLANLKLSADAAAFKSAVKFTGLVANSADPSLMASFWSQGSVGTNVALTGFVPADVMKSRYVGTYNSVTLRTDKGFDIDFTLELDADKPDGEVTVDYRVKNFGAAAKLTSCAILEAAYFALFNNGVDVGADATGYTISIAGARSGNPSITLANCQIKQGGGFAYGDGKYRTGDLTLATNRTIASNVLTALGTFSTV